MLRVLALIVVALLPVPAFAQADVSFTLQVITLESQAAVGQPVSMRLNLGESEEPLVYVVQVRDPDDYTALLWWREVEAGTQTADMSWIPEKEGRHTIQAFAWSNPETPAALSEPLVRDLDVSDTVSITYCIGSAHCFAGTVTRIIDGDTLDVGDTRIRLALVNTPERGDAGYSEATDFTASLCPVGSTVLVDQDDGQLQDVYNRMVAKVFCGGENLNAALLESGHAGVLTTYCDESEFASEAWARDYCFPF